jgi:hypothetical protein
VHRIGKLVGCRDKEDKRSTGEGILVAVGL